MHLRSVALFPEQYPTREHFPFNLEIFHRTTRVDFVTPITFFVGENGAGKSTLLQAIANRCGIHIWREVERKRFKRNPYEKKLPHYTAVEWCDGAVPGSFFGSDIFRTFAESLDEWAANDPGLIEYFGGKSLVTQSHGQSLMSFFRSRYCIRGLYLLDEPETALSPKTQLELLALLGEMAGGGHAQFIIATHSPILLSCPGATILSFDHAPVKPIPYEESEHYRVYRDFFERRGRT